MARTKIIPNRVFRCWLLSIQGLAPPIPGDGLDDPSGLRGSDAVAAMSRRLGFVQVDPIAVVARAQDQILFARLPSYRPAHLKKALEQGLWWEKGVRVSAQRRRRLQRRLERQARFA